MHEIRASGQSTEYIIGDSANVPICPSVLIYTSGSTDEGACTGTSEAQFSKQYGTVALSISQEGKAMALAEKHTRVRVVMLPYI